MKDKQIFRLCMLLLITVLFGAVKISGVFPLRTASSSLTAQVLQVVPDDATKRAEALKKSEDLLTRLSNLTKEIDQIDKDIKAAVLPGQVEIVKDTTSPTISFSKPGDTPLAIEDSLEKTLVVWNKSRRPVTSNSKSLVGLTTAFSLKGGQTNGACKEVIAGGEKCTIVVRFEPAKGNGTPFTDESQRYLASQVKFGYAVAGQDRASTPVTFNGKGYLPAEVEIMAGAAIPDTEIRDKNVTTIGLRVLNARRPFKNVVLSSVSSPFDISDNTCGQSTPLIACSIKVIFNPTTVGTFSSILKISWFDGKETQTKDVSITAKSFAVQVASGVTPEKNLLVVYNADWPESVTAKDYYLAHRPGFSKANTLGIQYKPTRACTELHCLSETLGVASQEAIEQKILVPIDAWKGKDIRFVVLMRGVPYRPFSPNMGAISGDDVASVQHQIRKRLNGAFVTSLDIGSLEATQAYIDKLNGMYADMSPKALILSSQGKRGSRYYFEDSFRTTGASGARSAEDIKDEVLFKNPALKENVNVFYRKYTEPHFFAAQDVLGFVTWGQNGGRGGDYMLNGSGSIKFSGNSSWYLIQTIESFNGMWVHGVTDPNEHHQGNFIKWFSKNAFGGSNYANTPVAAVTHIAEPGLGGINTPSLFSCWDRGNVFSYCAWTSSPSGMKALQAVGDPWVTK